MTGMNSPATQNGGTRKLCFCIVLYNSAAAESESVNSLIANFAPLSGYDVAVYLHNNGPHPVSFEAGFPEFVKVFTKERLDNTSLSFAYNSAINEVRAEYTCILDQDTELTPDYISAVKDLIESGGDMLLPLVYAEDVIRFPYVYGESGKNRLIDKETVIESSSFPRTIGSGVVISSRISGLVARKFGSVFDERFHIYKCDTAFFYRVNALENFKVMVRGRINQAFASHGPESNSAKFFRKSNAAGGWALQEKFYMHASPAVFVLKAVNRFLINGFKFRLFCVAVGTYFRGRAGAPVAQSVMQDASGAFTKTCKNAATVNG